MAKHRVTKIDAARRQIDQAILLFFDEGDAVPIHTIASAAWRILRDLSKKNKAAMLQLFSSHIADGKERDFWNEANDAFNFFKHANKDSDATLVFDDDVNEQVILIACMFYSDLAVPTRIMNVFGNWMRIVHPKLLKPGSKLASALELDDMRWLKTANRRQKLAFGKMLLLPSFTTKEAQRQAEAIVDLRRRRFTLPLGSNRP